MKNIQVNGHPLTPSKIICIGRNYVGHIAELNNEIPEEPVIFLKPNSAISDTVYAGSDTPIHYEGELCFVVRSGQLSAVGFGLDLTKRDVQSRLKAKGLPWERAKCFDGSAVFSEFVSFDGELSELSMQLTINGEVVQQATYELMMNKPQAILDEVSEFLSLEDGDIIMTGTPQGVGVLNTGDEFVGQINAAGRCLLTQSWTVAAPMQRVS
ncbi:MAG: 2-keto-4-pentenoate hydratase [Proteobacteria bacterium]|nr:MAG: 2-keto-4-pentenoate hydratase [Pseudomonadota bacterium]